MSFLLSDFDYALPENRIALYPIEPKDHAKLLVWKNEQIKDTFFYNIAEELPENTVLVANNTKVIPARLWFKKQGSDAIIEILCLKPMNLDIQQAMANTHHTRWECMIGNKKKWKNNEVLTQHYQDLTLSAVFEKNISNNTFQVHFSWQPADYTFSQVLECFGTLPLPPYLHRDTEDQDKKDYQTIFAQQQGAVAAPTAGLHFTERVLQSLQSKNISVQTVTLHVGAGTFMPVKTNNPLEHTMHYEKIAVSVKTLQTLYHTAQHNPVVAIGTTSLRTLETLYWLGVRLLNHEKIPLPYLIDEQNISLKYIPKYTFKESIDAILTWLDKTQQSTLEGYTNLYILPNTHLQSIDGLITNFHQPKSTLLMLISAVIGENWKKIYAHALANDYRFLSYGDANLYWKK
jgi:S-adenosylmethionine:tRNA ribosyltransferase-isomerase